MLASKIRTQSVRNTHGRKSVQDFLSLMNIKIVKQNAIGRQTTGYTAMEP